MSATAFQRMRREAEAKRLAEIEAKAKEEELVEKPVVEKPAPKKRQTKKAE